MFSRTAVAAFLAVIAGVSCLVLIPAPASADLFIFKDGFVVEGKLKQEGQVADEGGGMWIANGFFYVEDYSRRVFFSSKQVYEPMSRKYALEDPVPFYTSFAGGRSVFPISEVQNVGAFDKKAERRVTLTVGTSVKSAQLKLTQHIIKLTPTVVEMQTRFGDAPLTNWFACYQTRELDPDELFKLLSNHKDFEITPKTPLDDIPARRWKLFRFVAHAGWLDMAEKELAGIAKALPGEKDEIAKNRLFLNDLKTQKLFDQLRHAYEAGQHERAQKLIKDFPEKDVTDPKLLTDYRELRSRYEMATKKLEQVKKLLPALVEAIDVPANKKFFATVVKTIDSEMCYEEVLPSLRDADRRFVGRLENFLTVANPEKLLKPGAKIDPKEANELLCLAVSSWFMGNAAADKTLMVSQRLWNSQLFLQDYLSKELKADRKSALEAYQKDTTTALSPEEFAYLLGLMPPVDPGEIATDKTLELHTPDRAKVSYQLRLPTEYRHSRPYGYPVLFAMHDGEEEPKVMIERWAKMADEFGFILVAPKWTSKLQSTYNYTTTEHAAVLEVLRDLRRHYSVDSDRVFLHGLGEGASLVYDVGLSHPDLFAGLIPMSGNPKFFSKIYAHNAQLLPIYAVCGECCEQITNNRALFAPMGSHQFPVFLVTYRGRGPEFFAGEVPVAFDWMSRKVRAHPIDKLGINAQDFATMRTTDDHFYWLSADEIVNGCLNGPGTDWKGKTPAATMRAEILAKNHLIVHSSGMKQLSVLFSDDGMVNFNQPVRIVASPASGQPDDRSYSVKPSLTTLLEDFHVRGDNKRLILAKVEIKLSK